MPDGVFEVPDGGVTDFDDVAALPLSPGAWSAEVRVLSPLEDRLLPVALSLAGFEAGARSVGVPLCVVSELPVSEAPRLVPELPERPLGLVDCPCLPAPAAPEPDKPLVPCASTTDARTMGKEHIAIASSFFIALSKIPILMNQTIEQQILCRLRPETNLL